ncbi:MULTISPECIES: RNA polymerase sigma factor [Catenuloplanes]|uniref:Ketosteroid isomerase-like protein n=1 Tax=Catenuloplanes niger TaxID=587534 RepID=A0AAE4CQI3_9ACTN|nr:sigma-70 family RNA polymerase sigma factor [Catenuloplanes niger]MDR7320532.1 ketosteroid isomerase-like protein [Catenuloplanes niger]
MVDDLPTAEDVVQDVFAALYRRHGADLRGLAEPDAYLRTAVMNAARSVLRRRRHARAYVPPTAAPSPAAEDEALLRERDDEVLTAPPALTATRRRVPAFAVPVLLAVAAVALVAVVLLPGRPGPQRPAAPTPCPAATATSGWTPAPPSATSCPEPVTVHLPWYGRPWPWN